MEPTKVFPKVNDASISTTFKLILNWYGPVTTSSSITPTVWRTEFSNARTVIIFLFISPCPSLRAFYTAQRAFKPLPLSINTAGTIWARQDTKIESGCVWFATSLSSTGRTKLEKKAMRCIFTGYDEQKKGWRSHPTTNKAYVSPHVVFDEASSWWSTENVVLPDSESLDTSMRAQLPERQEVSVGSDSKPVESQK